MSLPASMNTSNPATAYELPARHHLMATASNASAKATTLLENLRRTPMLRGGRISECRRQMRGEIAGAIEAEGVLPRLATRIAFQLTLKFDEADLGDHVTWRAIGEHLRQEIEHLKTRVGLVERQIIVGLPKLSAHQIEELLRRLTAKDATIARTVLNVSLDAADPLTAARRYMTEYRRVAKQLHAIDPSIARTVANATFMARVPHQKATQHLKHFAELFVKFRDDVGFARTVARAACRAPDPIKAAKALITTYDAIVAALTSQGLEPEIARTLAGIASTASDPLPAAHKLLENFQAVVDAVSHSHPSVARSIALSACRCTDPILTALAYAKNYDAIVRMVTRIDPHRAREVASQAFRSDNPLRWAKRYLIELQRIR